MNSTQRFLRFRASHQDADFDFARCDHLNVNIIRREGVEHFFRNTCLRCHPKPHDGHFGDRIVARHIFTPPALEASNANLVGGDIGSGTMQLSQQLVLRPVPGLGRAETPIKGLYLASASAHPGGGVHGACGANAAEAALLHDRFRRT